MCRRSRSIDSVLMLIVRASILAFLCILAGAAVDEPRAAAQPTIGPDTPEEPPAGSADDEPDDPTVTPSEQPSGESSDEPSGESSEEPSGDPAGSADVESDPPADESSEATEDEPPDAAPFEPVARVLGQIVVDGNRRVSDSAFFNNLRLKTGDPYDERAIFDEFRRLWRLNLFDDISVESRRRASGEFDLIFHVVDRPLISNVAYVGMDAITETDIRERLSQASAEVRRGQPIDFSVLRRAEAAIEHLLGERGFLQARSRARLTPINQG
ncbi:MAG: POTRA domain-containing protein, partial [Acidobacteriota bacterium]